LWSFTQSADNHEDSKGEPFFHFYSTYTYKELTDKGGFFKISFGRIFCSAKNRALRGFAVRSGPVATRRG
jgi:hypothetical protein